MYQCFVYSCIQSGMFTEVEIDEVRFFVHRRTIPINKIFEVVMVGWLGEQIG